MIFLQSTPVVFDQATQLQGAHLTALLKAFTAFLNNGGQKIADMEAELCGAFLMFQAWRAIMKFGLTKTVGFSVLLDFILGFLWYQLATNAVAGVAAYMTWMGSIGSAVSGTGAVDGDVMHNPSLLVDLGGQAFMVLINQSTQFNPLLAGPAFLTFFIGGVIVMVCYAVLGVIVVLIVVDSTLEAMLGIALLPFIIEPELRFVAGRGIGLIIDAGLKLGAGSLAVGVSYGFLRNIHLAANSKPWDGILVALSAGACAAITAGVIVGKKSGAMALGAAKRFV